MPAAHQLVKKSTTTTRSEVFLRKVWNVAWSSSSTSISLRGGAGLSCQELAIWRTLVGSVGCEYQLPKTHQLCIVTSGASAASMLMSISMAIAALQAKVGLAAPAQDRGVALA